MLAFRIAIYSTCIAIGAAAGTRECHAKWTLLGPTPYLSNVDSPFPIDGSDTNFFLENFEDGVLNTRGIVQRNTFPIPGEQGLATVQFPSPRTDSVDADDGMINGFGRGGHSLASGHHLTLPMNPPLHQFLIEFEFNAEELGFLPNSFGIVWTDGPEFSSLVLRIVTENGSEFVSEAIHDLGDLSRDGETSDDVFVGLHGTDGIRTVTVIGGALGELSSPGAIEIDHVQYGYVVPEPRAIISGLLIATVLMVWRIYQRR